MTVLVVVRILALLLILVTIKAIVLEVKPETLQQYKEVCKNVTNYGVLRHSMLVGKTWKIYYSWNLRLYEECVELSFKYSNNMIIERIWKDMHGYLVKQPRWSDALLLMFVGKSRQILLFEDNSQVAGNFIGVTVMKPSLVRELFQDKSGVTLLQLSIKVLQKGMYVLASDCHLGVTALAAKKRPKRKEIEALAATMNFGDGFPACFNELGAK